MNDRLTELFESHEGEYGKFEHVPEAERRHPCPDLCAMLYLCEKLGIPRYASGAVRDVVEAAEHDEWWFAFDDLERLTSEDVLYLTRCGIRYDEDAESLASFV